MNGQSNESNPCQLCNASQSKDSWTENPGSLLSAQSIVIVFVSIYHFFLERKDFIGGS